jgi:hypothetical protein
VITTTSETQYRLTSVRTRSPTASRKRVGARGRISAGRRGALLPIRPVPRETTKRSGGTTANENAKAAGSGALATVLKGSSLGFPGPDCSQRSSLSRPTFLPDARRCGTLGGRVALLGRALRRAGTHGRTFRARLLSAGAFRPSSDGHLRTHRGAGGPVSSCPALLSTPSRSCHGSLPCVTGLPRRVGVGHSGSLFKYTAAIASQRNEPLGGVCSDRYREPNIGHGEMTRPGTRRCRARSVGRTSLTSRNHRDVHRIAFTG